MSDQNTDDQRWINFGRWLSTKRRRHDLTTYDLAETIGMRPERWSNIERGEHVISRATVIRMAEALGADVSEACQQAGYSLPDDYLDVPGMVEKFNYLSLGEKRQIAEQVNRLNQQGTVAGPVDLPAPDYVCVPYTESLHAHLLRLRRPEESIEDVYEEDTIA